MAPPVVSEGSAGGTWDLVLEIDPFFLSFFFLLAVFCSPVYESVCERLHMKGLDD